MKLTVPGSSYRVVARRQGSDRASFEHVFGGAYELDVPVEPKLIVDLGANAGYASVFFALRYPSARVIAVEPVPENAKLARRNVSRLGRVDVVEAAAWPRPARLRLVDPGKGFWGMRVSEDASGEIAAVTIPDLLNRAGADRIDILKVDIEGAEAELFSENTAWLERVDLLVLELHERFVPGCRAALDGAIKRSGVQFYETQRGSDVLLSTTQVPSDPWQ